MEQAERTVDDFDRSNAGGQLGRGFGREYNKSMLFSSQAPERQDRNNPIGNTVRSWDSKEDLLVQLAGREVEVGRRQNVNA
jgi:hypothetical protein